MVIPGSQYSNFYLCYFSIVKLFFQLGVQIKIVVVVDTYWQFTFFFVFIKGISYDLDV